MYMAAGPLSGVHPVDLVMTKEESCQSQSGL